MLAAVSMWLRLWGLSEALSILCHARQTEAPAIDILKISVHQAADGPAQQLACPAIDRHGHRAVARP